MPCRKRTLKLGLWLAVSVASFVSLTACARREPLDVADIRGDGDGVVFTTIYRGVHLAAATPGDPAYSYNFTLVAKRCAKLQDYKATQRQPIQIRRLPAAGSDRPGIMVTTRIGCQARYLDDRQSYGRVNWEKACLRFSAGWHTNADIYAVTAPGALAKAQEICEPVRQRAVTKGAS